MNIQFLYLNDYKKDEEIHFQNAGYNCIRCRIEDLFNENFPKDLKKVKTEVRSSRLNLEEYEKLNDTLTKFGVPIVSKFAFRIGHEFQNQYEILREFIPSSMIIDANKENEFILSQLTSRNIKTPIFVRTEIESAAKYVGFKGCLMQKLDRASLDFVLNNINSNIKNNQKLIFKELVELKIDKKTKSKMEFRAIILFGKFICFDADADSMEDYSVFKKFIVQITNKLNIHTRGSYFIDIAMTELDRFIVVEMKNFINGTISNMDNFVTNLKGQSFHL